MERMVEILALNSLGAALVAAGAWIVSHRLRSPAAVHVLWVLVLAKLERSRIDTEHARSLLDLDIRAQSYGLQRRLEQTERTER